MVLQVYKRFCHFVGSWTKFSKAAMLHTFPLNVNFNYFVFSSFQNVDHKMKFRSKKGQLPFIELNGEEIADSAIIIRELTAKFEKDVDAPLTQDQAIISHAFISMIENHLVWVLLWWRSKYHDQFLKGYNINLQHAMDVRLPNRFLRFIFRFTYGRKVRKVFFFN